VKERRVSMGYAVTSFAGSVPRTTRSAAMPFAMRPLWPEDLKRRAGFRSK
jgi:hypothetical protein